TRRGERREPGGSEHGPCLEHERTRLEVLPRSAHVIARTGGRGEGHGTVSALDELDRHDRVRTGREGSARHDRDAASRLERLARARPRGQLTGEREGHGPLGARPRKVARAYGEAVHRRAVPARE